MQKDFAMLAWGLLACAAAACGTQHRNERRSDFSVMELSPAQHDVHRLWEPGEVRPMPPEGAMARCRDGRYSFAQDHREACSDHGGVEKWLEAS